MKAFASIISGIGGALAATTAYAQDAIYVSQPEDWGWWHMEPGSAMMRDIEWFDAYTFWFITPITIFVMLLLLWVIIRFNSKANPTASKTSHNTTIEFVWTVAPIIVLIAIAVPSFQLLDEQLAPTEEPTLTVKANGLQWYWSYEYQDDSEISFDSLMLQEDDREEAGKTDKQVYPRLLAVDNELVVPVNEMIRVLVTADADGVIHDWAVPAFGIKIDAIPGRVNETWFKAEKEGLYYGQCSELCGKDHAFMPIAIRVVDRDTFEAWQDAALDDVDGANKAFFLAKNEDKNT
ncbi:MAG: cytochrome c oxidase subunit II, partial [Pseudomonadota bacterium]